MVDPEPDRSDTSDDVTASEAATYAFCAKAWHVEHVLGKAPSPGAAARRARGVHQHEEHGERIAARMRRSTKRLVVALVLLILMMLVLTVLLVGRT